jgi:hypothetical protein
MLPSVLTLLSTNYSKAYTTNPPRLPDILKRGILTPSFHILIPQLGRLFLSLNCLGNYSHFIGSLYAIKNMTFFNIVGIDRHFRYQNIFFPEPTKKGSALRTPSSNFRRRLAS